MPRSTKGFPALLVTPRWLGITAAVLALSVLFAFASSWQYHRAIDQVNAARAVASQPEPIESLIPLDDAKVPDDSLGRLASTAGSYVADAWVVQRQSPDGLPGVWLVSALDDGSGTLTPVLRGWLPERTSTPSSGEQVAVIGRVSSPENFYADIAAAADDELVAITGQRLAQLWDKPVRAGYVVLTEQQPGLQPGDPEPVKSVFGTDPNVDFPWQNASYALQWALFVAFVCFMYWRLLRDDLRAAAEGVKA